MKIDTDTTSKRYFITDSDYDVRFPKSTNSLLPSHVNRPDGERKDYNQAR